MTPKFLRHTLYRPHHGFNVAASELAAYAADPKGYIKSRGHFGSRRDRRRGVRMHAAAGLGRFSMKPRLLLFLATLIVIAYLTHRLWWTL